MGTLSWVRPIVTGISQRHKRKFEVTPQPQIVILCCDVGFCMKFIRMELPIRSPIGATRKI